MIEAVPAGPSPRQEWSLQQHQEAWIEAEGSYWPNDYQGKGEPGSIRYAKRDLPLVFAAPHAVVHHREGVRKKADKATGGLAESTAVFINGSFVATAGVQSGDPSFDRDVTAFKQALFGMLTPASIVIDLHGMSDQHGLDLCFGTGADSTDRARALSEIGAITASDQGLVARINDPFTGSREEGITVSAQRRGSAAVQIEIAARFREPLFEAAPARVLLRWFRTYVDRLQQELGVCL